MSGLCVRVFSLHDLCRSVIVVGGGLAGLSATIEAFSGGAHVTLIEKEARLGGNSAKASSGMLIYKIWHDQE